MRSSFYAIAILVLTVTVIWGGAQFNTTIVKASGGEDALTSNITSQKTDTEAVSESDGESVLLTTRGRYDFMGTPGLADFGVLTFPTAGGQIRWLIAQNDNPTRATSNVLNIPWGLTNTDFIPNVGNYLGDNRPDFTVYRGNAGSPAPNSYLVLENANTPGSQKYQSWGTSTTDFIGAEGDYNGDGVIDFTVVRAVNANDPWTWYILNSGSNTLTSFVYGSSTTDIPMAGSDYVGDTKDDPMVIRIAPAGQITFLVGTTSGTLLKARQWGTFNTDFVVPGGDYDGDGKADFAVWRGFGAGTNGFWYILRANDTTMFLQWGQGGTGDVRDTAIRGGDYDGDGKDDIGVYRPSTRQFIIRRSVDMGTINQGWGIAGNDNVPIASFGIQ